MIKHNVSIYNEKELEKFYSRLWVYKSFIYRFVKFKINTDINDDQLKIIENALNIKNRKKRITYIFDTACDYIDNKNKGVNICGFRDGKCFVQQCKKNNLVNGCCRKCIYRTSKGCPSKNVACKLFNCSEVTSRYETIKYEDLKMLKLYNFKNRTIVKHDYFTLREDALKDLYSYTFIYATFRIFIRFIINLIYNKFVIEKNERLLHSNNIKAKYINNGKNF